MVMLCCLYKFKEMKYVSLVDDDIQLVLLKMVALSEVSGGDFSLLQETLLQVESKLVAFTYNTIILCKFRLLGILTENYMLLMCISFSQEICFRELDTPVYICCCNEGTYVYHSFVAGIASSSFPAR